MRKGTGMAKFVALTADGMAARYGYEGGVGHAVFSDVVRPGGDHIGGAGAVMVTVCGGKGLESGRVAEKFAGDRMCKRCDAVLMSGDGAGMVRAALDEWAREESGTAADMVAEPEAMDMGTGAPGDVSESTPGNTDRVTAALAAARERVAAQDGERESEGDVSAPVEIQVPADTPAPACDADGMDKGTMARLTADKLTDRAAAAELRDAADGTAGKRERQAREWVRATDTRCAVRVLAEALGDAADGFGEPDADGMVTVTLSGRMLMPVAEAVAAGVKGASVVPVGKSAGALAPLPLKGGPEDGVRGVCPVCREVVSVTGSGAVGTHRAGGVTPDAPQLSQREVPAVDRRGEPTRDAAKRRQGEAYRREVTVALDPMAPVADQVAAVMAAVNGDARANGVREVTVSLGRGLDGRERRTADLSTAGDAEFGTPVRGRAGIHGARNHGRSDGVAMSPRGETGYAGWTFDRGESVSYDEKTGEIREVRVKAPTSRDVVGGEFGHKSQAEYDAMSPRAQKRYRQVVNNRRRSAEQVREAARVARKVAGAEREAQAQARVGNALENVVGFLVDTVAGKPETRRKRMQSGTTGHNPVDNGAHFTHTDVTVVKVDGSKRAGKGSGRKSA